LVESIHRDSIYFITASMIIRIKKGVDVPISSEPEQRVYAAKVGVYEKLKYSDIPAGSQGLGIVFISEGLMALGFIAFSGIQL